MSIYPIQRFSAFLALGDTINLLGLGIPDTYYSICVNTTILICDIDIAVLVAVIRLGLVLELFQLKLLLLDFLLFRF